MKSLKITFLLLAVLFMTMSGTSSDQIASQDDKVEIKTYKTYDLVAHKKGEIKLPSNG